MDNVKLFLEETFASGVSIDNVFNSLGGDLNGIVFFLQSFEVWLNKRASKNVELVNISTNNARDEICAKYKPNGRCAYFSHTYCRRDFGCQDARKLSPVA